MSGRAATLSVALFVVVIAIHTTGLVLAPTLLPGCALALLALRPTPTTLVLAGGLVDPLAAFAVAAPARLLMDLAYFLVARYDGVVLLRRYRWGRAVIRPATRHGSVRTLLALAVVWASTPADVGLGLGPTSVMRFLVFTGAGTAVSTSFYLVLGHQVAEPLVPVMTWISAHGGVLTATLLAGIVCGAVIGVLRGRRLDR